MSGAGILAGSGTGALMVAVGVVFGAVEGVESGHVWLGWAWVVLTACGPCALRQSWLL